jgi:hyperosmotically inducible protein
VIGTKIPAFQPPERGTSFELTRTASGACRQIQGSRPEVPVNVLSAATLLFVLPFVLQLEPASAQEADIVLTGSAARSVSTYSRYTVFDDIAVTVDAGEVVLTGKVTQPLKKEELGRRMADLPGVRSVRNEIEVLPVSIGDDRIRRSVARAIYGSPTFWRFAAMPNPPIHIIVENGRLTLTGVVPTGVERAVAQSLASGHGELSLMNQLRTDGELRASNGR